MISGDGSDKRRQHACELPCLSLVESNCSFCTEGILEDGLGLAQCCDLISACLFPVLIAGIAFSTSWLQVLEVLHDCIKLRGSVLQCCLQALHLLLQRVLLGGVHRSVLLGLLQ